MTENCKLICYNLLQPGTFSIGIISRQLSVTFSGTTYTPSVFIAEAQWSHVAVSYNMFGNMPVSESDYSHLPSATQSISVYINGALSFNAVIFGALTVSDTIMIGSRGGVAYFNGAIDELNFFKIPIGQQHVQLV